jgi:hypothetical protein
LPCRSDKDMQLVSYSKAGNIFFSRHFGKPRCYAPADQLSS